MRLARLALALPLALACRPAAADEAVAKLVESKAASVVNVKFVVKVQMGRQGGQERERNANATGVVVDAAGVVMIPADLFGGGGRGGRGFGAVTVSPPTNLRVVFEGDVKEYEAILGATDSKLGLSFLRVKDLGDKKIVPIDLAASVEPKVGDELFGVSRLPQGFDYAPFYGETRLVGLVTKPRSMWLVNGFGAVAHPLYDAAGKTAGILIRQSGVAEGDDQGPALEQTFLLPAKAAAGTIAQAIKQCAEALEKAKAQAKEGTTDEGGAAMGDAPAKPPDAPPGMN